MDHRDDVKKLRASYGSRAYRARMLQTSSLQGSTKRIGGVTGKGWMPGQSGNPKGRSGERRFKGKTLAELARSMTHEALQVVGEVLRMPDVSPALRLQAADIVLRRGWGDAPRADPNPPLEGVTFVVRTLPATPGPIAGVLCSPIAEHVSIFGSDPRKIDQREQQRGLSSDRVNRAASDAVNGMESTPMSIDKIAPPGGMNRQAG